jgi:hypothetical protein
MLVRSSIEIFNLTLLLLLFYYYMHTRILTLNKDNIEKYNFVEIK